ncbi:MAG: Gfo/Idh/MocA family oxidoreductase [Candidatus Latescibacteria bacterium]|jgi:predicted dehydrogenase|nr:Gfo/Idh/MocA family oxidoreductase [Candidatus Latescibacterota bacterium]MDP7448182.1 Gfo/Idh/MocA family oxidoreductase [Candidatus Latescibacterota bacterium]HJP32791.1 Gfo/Idh/MocA family oxidoreductase [Candidatus Latescibacterota bacterium]
MSNTLRTAVVGVRGVGRGHVQTVAAHPRADLVAVADLDPDAASAAAEPHGARAFDGLDRMLAEAPELDAIILATPHHLHAPMSLRALEQGLHVYVEKPIATRISDADRIVAAAADAERVLAVGHQYRTFRGNLRLKQIIDGGELGQVQRVVWQWLEARPETYYARDPWRCRWAEAGGGVLLNQASHDIDLLCWLFGPASEVSATVGNRGHDHEVEDTAVATVRFASGVVASLQFSTWNRRLSYRQIDGDAGAVIWKDESNANVPDAPETFRLGRYHRPLAQLIPDPESALTAQPEPAWEDVDCAAVDSPTLFDSFVAAILDGGVPITDGASARGTTELICGILLAGLRHQVVTFPVDRGAFDELMDDLITGRLSVPSWGPARP